MTQFLTVLLHGEKWSEQSSHSYEISRMIWNLINSDTTRFDFGADFVLSSSPTGPRTIGKLRSIESDLNVHVIALSPLGKLRKSKSSPKIYISILVEIAFPNVI